MDNWKEYNRMIVHMGEPHEQISLKKEDIKRMWKAFPHALLIRYTDNWDKKDSARKAQKACAENIRPARHRDRRCARSRRKHRK